ncbi:Nif3-like dinuclear metal center hexameric protein [Paraflavitalea speifideaquila]|uniref:Nif3-like dinuclear metal center hexameric protein n=1 Tax=Paraflavitalea speifideaquila TaxID=3076558 RepID=UPI0028E481F6|nr:Nif3-like dinuclear metal center hexameric protein [Paraflavitalea speifideiaquila]
MHIAAIIAHLESIAPPSLQEGYDNAGLLTGDAAWECTGVLCTLDATEAVILEAVTRNCNMVVAHHPIIFGGLKKINGKNYVEKAVIAAIKHDIAIYAIHTNLDHVLAGVNGKMADRLGLEKGASWPLNRLPSKSSSPLYPLPMSSRYGQLCLLPAGAILASTVNVALGWKDPVLLRAGKAPTPL